MLPIPGTLLLGNGLQLLPLRWGGLAALKNLVQRLDPGSTVFPVARGTLARTSLGIGARFTTALHWPAVAWVMKEARSLAHGEPELHSPGGSCTTSTP